MNYTLDIDNLIGQWYVSKHSVKDVLNRHKNKAVNVRMSSLGGDLAHGLDIMVQFEEHGDVTVDLVSFNASAATVIAMGAKHVRMHASGNYLIHKVMSPVNEWGYMNEDDIQALIDKLEKDKHENAKITLQLARIYVAKTGKGLTEILNLMKENTWLNAEEALEWGFVDEIYGSASEKVNFAGMEGKFNALGLPIADRFRPENSEGGKDSKFEKMLDVVNGKIDGLKELVFNLGGSKEKNSDKQNNNPKIVMKKDWTHINTILGVEGVELAEGKANLAEDQLLKLNEALEKANADKKAAEEALAEKETELTNLKNAAGDTTDPSKKETDDGGGNKENVFGKDMADAKTMFNLLNQK